MLKSLEIRQQITNYQWNVPVNNGINSKSLHVVVSALL